MSTPSENWSFQNGILDIFGAKGQRVGAQAYLGTSLDKMTATQPHGLYAQMTELLAKIHDHHGGNLIDHIGVNEFLALQLFFEKLLPVEALADAVETPGIITAVINFCRKPHKIIIRKYPAGAFGFYDQSGQLLPYRI